MTNEYPFTIEQLRIMALVDQSAGFRYFRRGYLGKDDRSALELENIGGLKRANGSWITSKLGAQALARFNDRECERISHVLFPNDAPKQR